jgi:ArsR family metal-binding transcriptional regulator
MLIEKYRMEFCRPPNPKAEHLRCVAFLDRDIAEVLPYLNTVLCAHQYFSDPPSLTLKLPGKLVTLHPKQIAVNILKDEREAENILQWLQQKINETWAKRDTIEPTHNVRPQPRILDILKMLPRTNCGRCEQPTCMVFAVRISSGAGRVDDCPVLDEYNKRKIQGYLQRFQP